MDTEHRTGSSSPATAAPCCWASASARCSSPPTPPRSSATRARSSTSTTVSWRRSPRGGYRTFTLDDRSTAKSPRRSTGTSSAPRSATTPTSCKEIAEQPRDRADAAGRLDERFSTAHLGGLNLSVREAREFRRVKILGCGSARAGRPGRAADRGPRPDAGDVGVGVGVPYHNPVVEPDTLYVAVSQSGETVDTLAAVELQRKGGRVIGIVNVVGSTIARQCDGGICTCTRARRCRWRPPSRSPRRWRRSRCWRCTWADARLSSTTKPADHGARRASAKITEILELGDEIGKIARDLAPSASMLFIGRRRGWPVAREGAQKLKEISYIHAEAYASAELNTGRWRWSARSCRRSPCPTTTCSTRTPRRSPRSRPAAAW